MESMPIILDTDIGSDIDDAVALAYLLRQPRCELLGITTVTGDVAKRAACADVVCRAAGRREIPIHCGASGVLLTGPGQPECPQYDAIEKHTSRMTWPQNSAVDFLRRTIRQRPGEVTLLTIGPLTNIALLFAIAPDVPPLLKQVISMAGVYYDENGRCEWNCMVDPVAAAIVYRIPLPRHISFGLDVTLQCQMPAREVRDRFRRPPLDVVREMAEVWFTRSEKLTFHDPLAAAAVFHPELCMYEDGEVNVCIDPGETKSGRTHFAARPGGRHRVARGVSAGRFFEEYFSVAGRES